MNCNH